RRERAPKPYKRDSSGGAPASPPGAYPALLEKGGRPEPADRGGGGGIGPGPTRPRPARAQAVERVPCAVGGRLGRASEANAAFLGSLAALAGPSANKLALEFGRTAKHRDHQLAVRRGGVRPRVLE